MCLLWLITSLQLGRKHRQLAAQASSHHAASHGGGSDVAVLKQQL
jgi:hypothetical protein